MEEKGGGAMSPVGCKKKAMSSVTIFVIFMSILK